ncbi:MAG: GNAT family N-acetyltransferase [Clostridiales bacterium]|nr:GNAT family N-acetyltransferase [Clostridiales bacterium]
MDDIRLVRVSEVYADQIAAYRDAFPADRPRVTASAERIPGLDHLEGFPSVHAWLAFCRSMAGKISWFLAFREVDGRLVGCSVLRHALAYDDDDAEFASHIGYSVRPDERRRGYAKELLRLTLAEADKLGLDRVRLVCVDTNTGSRKAILANGGVYLDSIRGEESSFVVQRYDIALP